MPQKQGERAIAPQLNNGIRDGLLERIAYYIAYLYIGLPVVIFVLGWIRWYIAVPLTAIILVSFFMCYLDKSRIPIVSERRVSRSTLTGMLLLVCVWAYLSGIGGLVYQNGDHPWRNSIFKALVEYRWPVSKSLLTSTGYQTKFISYYIGFWLPAALFGKVFGLNAGYTFQFVWSLLGLGSLIILIAGKTKRWSVATVLVFIFFSGLDILGCLLTGWDLFNMNISEHIELWSRFQYSSHTTQLFWVYNQAIYAWILTMLIMSEDNKRLVLIWSCGLLECTFPFVGMIPFLVYRIIKNVQWKAMKSQRFTKWTGGLFSFENIMGGGVIGIVSFLYLFNNSASLSSSGGVDWSKPANVFVYLLFVFLEAVVYIIAVYRDQKRNPLLWICLVVLLLCPVLRVGYSIDFCMRACIPALLVLCLMVIESLYIAWEGNRRRYFAILAVFLIGAVTPMHELIRTTINTYNLHTSSGETIVYIGEDSVFDSPNFTADAADSFFAQHFMEMDNVWRYGKIDHSGGVIGEITDGHLVEQRFKTYEDITIGSVNVSFATYARTNDCTLDVVMLDPDENMTTLTTIDCNVLQDNTILPIVIEPYAVKKDEWYSVQFISHGAKKGNAVTIYRTKKDKGQDWEYAAIDGKKKKYDLAVGFGK